MSTISSELYESIWGTSSSSSSSSILTDDSEQQSDSFLSALTSALSADKESSTADVSAIQALDTSTDLTAATSQDDIAQYMVSLLTSLAASSNSTSTALQTAAAADTDKAVKETQSF